MKIEPKEYITPDYREIMEYVEKHDIENYTELICYAYERNKNWLKIIDESETGRHFFSDWMWDREKERKKKRKRKNRE